MTLSDFARRVLAVPIERRRERRIVAVGGGRLALLELRLRPHIRAHRTFRFWMAVILRLPRSSGTCSARHDSLRYREICPLTRKGWGRFVSAIADSYHKGNRMATLIAFYRFEPRATRTRARIASAVATRFGRGDNRCNRDPLCWRFCVEEWNTRPM